MNNIDKFGQSYSSDDDSSKWSNQSPAQSKKQHLRSDVDVSVNSQHHTLGPKRTQASPGDHTHDGSLSRKIGPVRLLPNGEGTEPALSIPDSYTLQDVVDLLSNFVEFRHGTSSYQAQRMSISFTNQSQFAQAVVFPNPYPTGVIPVVMTNIATMGTGANRWGSRAVNVTNTGFQFFVFKCDAADPATTWTSAPVSWMSMI